MKTELVWQAANREATKLLWQSQEMAHEPLRHDEEWIEFVDTLHWIVADLIFKLRLGMVRL